MVSVVKESGDLET